MNHYVPDFETDEDYLLPESSSLKRHKKSTMGDDDIMELLWQNGQVVMQSQNQRSVGNNNNNNKKSETTPSGREIRSGGIEDETTTTPCNLFMQEDEMVSWLHYPADDNNNLDMYLHNNNDLMYSALPSSSSVIIPTTSSQPSVPPAATVTAPAPRPPIPPAKRVEVESNQPKFSNFLHFSRPSKGSLNLTGSAPANSNKTSQVTQSTVVESNDRLVHEPLQSRASRVTDNTALVSGANVGFRGGTSSGGREPETYDISASSSPGTGGSGASASVEPASQKPQPMTEDRKRKGIETDETECYSEDAEFEYHDAKKQKRGSTSAKRTRAAEVHNLSERRRRDRINEKMKALQELIPRCNKSDKASMLDEAIEHLKSLQMQLQMMSMGYNMVPMMFPAGVQRYMPAMAPMGMGMGMEHVGMNRPMVPYPQVLPGSAMPNPAAAAAHLGQRFPVPQFQMAQVPIMGPTSSQPANPPDPMMNSFPMQNASQPRVPFADPYQQYIALSQTQMLQPQNQPGMPAVTSNKPSSSKDIRDPEHHPTS